MINAPFVEGALVKAGSLLFEIDARPFIAKHEETKAEVARAKATMEIAEQEYARAERLNAQDAIAREEVERKRADFHSATAALQAAVAKEAAAGLDVEFTKVKAPITGRAGRALVKPGNLVSGGAGSATLLSTLVAQNPMHVHLTVDEPAYRQLTALRAAGKNLKAEVKVGDGNVTTAGTIDYLSNALEPRSGTAQVRAVIENADGLFAPGLFARVAIIADPGESRLLVPETALGSEQGSRYVLVLDPENKLVHRRVQLGERRGEERVVTDGLAPDETIVIGSLQKLRAGMVVRPAEPQLASK